MVPRFSLPPPMDHGNVVPPAPTAPATSNLSPSDSKSMDSSSPEPGMAAARLADDPKHAYFMQQALLMVSRTSYNYNTTRETDTRNQGEKALTVNETPVGCVLVHNDQIVARGMNDTNRTMNVGTARLGTRRARALTRSRGHDTQNSSPSRKCSRAIPSLPSSPQTST